MFLLFSLCTLFFGDESCYSQIIQKVEATLRVDPLGEDTENYLKIKVFLIF